MTKTITQMVDDMRDEIARGNLLPGRAADMLTNLSALLGNVLDEIQEKEMAYNKLLLHHYETEEKANRAKIKSEVSDEYQALRKAKNTYEVCREIIRSLKYFLREQEEVYRQSGN